MKLKICKFFIIVAMAFTAGLAAENIDPDNDGSQFAYGENVGWLNFEPDKGVGVTITDSSITGYVWAENIGWINLSPAYGGVFNDGTGLLYGYAWSENAGWIKFTPDNIELRQYGVTIDGQGSLNGWAWGENIGWIHFSSQSPLPYKVKTSWITACTVGIDDLGRFAETWLSSGAGDFDQSGRADFRDYTWLAEYWLGLCPPGWPLN